jgi:CRISPR-associated endonuclease/helicase Cas3
MTAFFDQVFGRMRTQLDAKEILSQFEMAGCEYVTNFAYRTVGQDFVMIDDVMSSIVVPFGTEDVDTFLNDLSGYSSLDLSRHLQNHTIQVPQAAAERLRATGQVQERELGQYGAPIMLLMDQSLYHNDVGLIWEDNLSSQGLHHDN